MKPFIVVLKDPVDPTETLLHIGISMVSIVAILGISEMVSVDRVVHLPFPIASLSNTLPSA